MAAACRVCCVSAVPPSGNQRGKDSKEPHVSENLDTHESAFRSAGHETGVQDFALHLQDLVLDSPDVRDFLADVVSIIAQELSSTRAHVACGITVIRHKRPVAVAGSDTRAKRLDEIQNGFGHGPCLTALRLETVIHVPDLATDLRWPTYNRAASKAGVGSILALPMQLKTPAQAVVNLYSTTAHAFSGQNIDTAVFLTNIAAKSLDLALSMARLREARDDLSAALRSRTVIDTAIGAIMAQNRCSHDAAFQILVQASSHRNIKLREVAASIIAGIAGEHDFPTAFDE